MRQIRSFFLIPVAVVAVAVAAAGCGGGGGSLPSDAVARVGNVTITQAQFQQLMQRAKQSYAANGQTFPKQGTAAYDQVKSQAVQFLVQRTEFAQEAQKMGITVTQADINKRLDQLKKQYFKGNEAQYQKQLKARHLTQQEVEQDIRDQLISQKLFNKVTADTKVTDKDIANYYKGHMSLYEQPESRTVRHILISVCGSSTPKGSKCLPDAKAKALANNLYDRIKAGASFSALAKKYSQDPGSASQGGKLTISKGQTVAPFDQTAFLLGVGTVSRPLKTQYGYHLIMPISNVTPAKTTPLKQVTDAIRQQLLQQRKQEAMAKWVADVEKASHVIYAATYKPVSTSTTATTGGATVPATTSAGQTTTG